MYASSIEAIPETHSAWLCHPLTGSETRENEPRHNELLTGAKVKVYPQLPSLFSSATHMSDAGDGRGTFIHYSPSYVRGEHYQIAPLRLRQGTSSDGRELRPVKLLRHHTLRRMVCVTTPMHSGDTLASSGRPLASR